MDRAGSKALGSARQENDHRKGSRRTLVHANADLDTGPEEEFDWLVQYPFGGAVAALAFDLYRSIDR